MRNILFYITIIFILFFACAKEKGPANISKEITDVRALVNKIPTKIGYEGITANTPKESSIQELVDSTFKDSVFVYQYKNRRDPFYSLLSARVKMREALKEKEKEEERKKKTMEMSGKFEGEENIEIAAIMGSSKKYLVLFRSNDNIFQKSDFIDKEKKMKIINISKNSVDLLIDRGNGKESTKRISMKSDGEDKK